MKFDNKFPFTIDPMNNKSRLSLNKIKSQKNFQDTIQNKPFRILNLSQLLDHKVIPPSEAIMRDRLTSQPSIKHKDKPKLQNLTQNTSVTHKRTPLKINYQHYRSKSTSTIKNYYQSIQSPFQNKTHFVNFQNSQQNIVFLKSKSLTISPQVQGVSLATSFQNQQFLSQNTLKNKNYAFRQEIYASSKTKSNDAMLIMSLQYKKNHQQDKDKEPLSKQKDRKKIKYLKKGSSLQKQIVVNLLKNKLIKEHQESIKKEYTEYDILNMVKLYKGFLGFPKSTIKNPQVVCKPIVEKNSKLKLNKQNCTLKDQEFLRTYQSLPERIVQKYPKPIIGWETAPEHEIEEFKSQQYTQITMDHSYGIS